MFPFLLLLFAASPSADTLRLTEAIRLAREANPMLRAQHLRAMAATERIWQAAAFPDPTVRFGLENRMLKGFGTEDPMTMNTLAVSQMLPWPGKRGFGRDAARSRATADSLDAVEAGAMLTARVTELYAMIAGTDRSLVVMRQTLQLLRSFQETATSMYSVGQGIQQDVLQAQVSVARMSADVAVMEQERIAAAARFNATLARAPDASVGALELPTELAGLAPLDSLAQLAYGRRPALAAAQARIQATATQVQGARREVYPDLMLGLQYSQRPRYDDMGSLMLGFTLPVFAGSRQVPMRREMQAMQAMQEAEALDLRNETWARLAELRAMAERAQRLSVIYETTILPQARAAVEAALSAYRVGEADFMTLVESQMTVNRYAIERIRLSADYLTARAEVEALLGGPGALP
jgi:outer membrane protein TolC